MKILQHSLPTMLTDSIKYVNMGVVDGDTRSCYTMYLSLHIACECVRVVTSCMYNVCSACRYH